MSKRLRSSLASSSLDRPRGSRGEGGIDFHDRISPTPVLIVLFVIFQYGLLSY